MAPLLITKTGANFGRRMQQAKTMAQLKAIGEEVAQTKGLTSDDLYLLKRTYAFWREEEDDAQ